MTDSVKREIEDAITNAVGVLAADYQRVNMHTHVQYAIAHAFGFDAFTNKFGEIIDRYQNTNFMSEAMLYDRRKYGIALAKFLKATKPTAYDELQKYNVLYSLD